MSNATSSTATPRTVQTVVPSSRQLEGAGFVVRRPFPTPRLSLVDPFLLLDEMGPTEVAPGQAKGAPDHPHRGFETVTYMLDGVMEHEDSAGNAGRIGPGDVQWMTAGSGVIHSEMPSPQVNEEGGRMHGFQLWVNLPAADKMISPRYQEYSAAQIPRVEHADGAVLRVIAGEVEGVRGPVETHSPVAYVHATLPPGASAAVPTPASHHAMTFTFEGDGDGELAIFADDGDTVELRNDGSVVREVLVLAGEPLREPVARYGPFVMSTSEEIEQAINDYRTGQFGVIAR